MTLSLSAWYLLFIVGEALLSFRASIIDSDGVLLQWKPEEPHPCKWKGITCDPKTKRVIYL